MPAKDVYASVTTAGGRDSVTRWPLPYARRSHCGSLLAHFVTGHGGYGTHPGSGRSPSEDFCSILNI